MLPHAQQIKSLQNLQKLYQYFQSITKNPSLVYNFSCAFSLSDISGNILYSVDKIRGMLNLSDSDYGSLYFPDIDEKTYHPDYSTKFQEIIFNTADNTVTITGTAHHTKAYTDYILILSNFDDISQ